jgi:hypothetical protein
MYSDRTPSHSNDETVVDWSAFVAGVIHPLKVQVIEAMRWIGMPISAVKLEQVFDGAICLSNISYHMESLKKLGMVELIEKRPVRGAHEKLYFLADSAVSGVVEGK